MRAIVGCLVLGLAVASGSARAGETRPAAAVAIARVHAPRYRDVLLNNLDPVSRLRVEGLQRVRRTMFLKLSHNFRR